MRLDGGYSHASGNVAVEPEGAEAGEIGALGEMEGIPSEQGGPRFYSRAAKPRRHTGHGKQGVWHLHSEEPGCKYVPSRSFSKTVAMRGDGKHDRGYRDTRGLFALREYRGGQFSETSRGSFPMMPKLPENGDILRDQHDKRSGANRLSPSQKVDENRLADSVDWKSRKWMHRGSLSSGSSGLRHSNGPKSASCSVERDVESQLKITVSLQSSSEKAADFMFSTDQSEGLTSKKKPRLGWGEGLAKYEKKKVEGPVGSPSDRGIESNQSICLDAADRTSGVFGALGSSSPATSSSLACSSLSDTEDKIVDTMKMNGHIDNLYDLPISSSQSANLGFSADMEKLDESSVDVDPSLVQLLHSNDISLPSGFAESSSVDKLPLMKDGVLKALLKIEYEIDLLENELKSIESESRVARASSISSSFTVKNYGSCSTGQDDFASIIPPAATLQIESPGDTGPEEVCHVKGTHSDCYVTAASDMFVKDNRMENEDAAQHTVTEMVKVVPGTRREETVKPFEHVKLAGDAESKLCDLILSSNKEYAQRSSAEIFNKLLLGDHDKLDAVKVGKPYCCQDDPRTREKFTQRKQFLIFKERALALKFKAFHHLWQKDMCELSLRKSQSKTWKKLESSLRIKLGGCKKPRSSICPRVFSPGIMSLMPNKEVIHYTSKLLTDTPQRIYREALKMPALILEEREKIASRFLSFNGLVNDPCAVEKERTMINPWTVDEREIFLEKLGKYGKDFRRIASFLDHKTTADCVEFYYKNHKSEDFQGWKKNLDTGGQPKLNSVNTYMVTSGQMRNRTVNAVSLDLLSEASLVASRDLAETGSDELERRICPRRSFLRPCSSSRSSRVNSLDDERRAVAGDILTDIHSSMANTKSSEENDLSDWTDAERSTFMQGVSRYGKDFAMISQYMKTRSKDQCRAFFSKARKCLGLDSMLPAAVAKPLNSDASAGGDDMDGPSVVKNGPIIRKDNSVADKNHELLITVKVETTDAIDCGSSTDQKEAAYGSCPKGSQVCEEKASRISLESHDFLPEIDLNEQVSDQSLRATERWSAHLAANLSPCSVSSHSSEFKDQSLVETEQVEKPPLSVVTDSASYQYAEVKTQNCDHQPELQEQFSHDSEENLHNLQELESPSQGGDFKLFGKRILTHMPCQKNPDSDIHGGDKKGIPMATLNLTSSGNRGGEAPVPKFIPDNRAGLENIPIKSYGFWDGTRVRTVTSLPDSAFLLAKYPAAFSKRQDAYLGMQRCNGLEAISGIKQQGGNGMVGMNVGARGVLVGGSCTDLSDPVAAMKMHYALVNQCWGQGANLTKEDSQRDAANMET